MELISARTIVAGAQEKRKQIRLVELREYHAIPQRRMNSPPKVIESSYWVNLWEIDFQHAEITKFLAIENKSHSKKS